jgi:hypothetical protein
MAPDRFNHRLALSGAVVRGTSGDRCREEHQQDRDHTLPQRPAQRSSDAVRRNA